MKCKNCHTNLPEFKRFERQICPNCGTPVFAAPQNSTHSGSVLVQTCHNAQRSLDKTVVALLLLEICAAFFVILAYVCKLFDLRLLLVGSILLLSIALFALLLLVRLLRAIRDRSEMIHSLPPSLQNQKQFVLKKAGYTSFSVLLGPLFVGLFFSISLILFGCSAADAVHFDQHKEQYVTVDATIADIVVTTDEDGESQHDVYVSYTYEQQHFDRVPYHTYTSSMKTGDKLSVIIDPAAPDVIARDHRMSTVVFALLTVFSGLGLWYIILRPLYKRKIKQGTFSK